MCREKPFNIVQIAWLFYASDLFFICRDGEDIDAGTETNSNLYHELYYHFIGTDQSQDILCWRDSENPKYMFGAEVTDDGKVTQAVLILGYLTLIKLLNSLFPIGSVLFISYFYPELQLLVLGSHLNIIMLYLHAVSNHDH